ncbi:MAG: GNAT family N-acetyltransferase [Chloroflexi bacterium]|nr:GNAT family N-acetyltransferase [Chloroflexota bacterium]
MARQRALKKRLLGVWDGSDLVGIAPLDGAETIGFAGGVEIADYLDIVAAPGYEAAVWAAVLDHLEALDWDTIWDTIELHNVPEWSPTRSILPSLAQARGLVVEQEVEDVAPWLKLPGDWDAYLGQLSKKDRHELRRKMRRLETSGDVHWYAVPSTVMGSALDHDVADFIRLHRLSREEKAVFMTPAMEQFFHQLAHRFLPSGMLKLYFLELDRVRVATTICFDYHDEILLYNSGYDPAYAHLAVGLLLKAYCIHDAIAARRSAFDFLQGNERYKYDLGGVDRAVYRITLRRPPVGG